MYIDPADKSALSAARIRLQSLASESVGSANWQRLLDPLIVGKSVVTARLGGEANARETAKNMTRDLASMYYTEDNSAMQSKLNAFRQEYRDEFTALFGSGLTVDDLASFMIVSRSQLATAVNKPNSELTAGERAELGIPGASGQPQNLRDALIWGTQGQLTAAMPILVKYSMQEALTSYPQLDNKLTEVGWSVDLFIQQQKELAQIIDLGNQAQLALARAAVRSQSFVTKDGSTIDPNHTQVIKGDTLQAAVLAKYGLTIMGREAGGLADYVVQPVGAAKVTTVVDDTSNTVDLRGTVPEQDQLIFYRQGGNAQSDWIVKLNITVQGTAPSQLVINTTPAPVNGRAGEAYVGHYFSGNITGGTAPYTYSATGLPSAMALNGSTGFLSGTPAQSGDFTFTVTVTDSSSASASASFTMHVINTNNILANLGIVPAGTLNPAFSPLQTDYRMDVAQNVTQVQLTPTAQDANIKKIEVLKGTSLISVLQSGQTSAVNLDFGDNTVAVKVTAESDAARTYTLIIRRAYQAANNQTITASSSSPVAVNVGDGVGGVVLAAASTNTLPNNTVTAQVGFDVQKRDSRDPSSKTTKPGLVPGFVRSGVRGGRLPTR
ncbi:cadherin-like beta sandwich domain-containing protein, partial [Enterobacter kobei]|uniref:cadherin-like beta sandwich domain-containing protein n=1 Tax=Enterobacter kobei TaxID=208224 RepID=UPI0028744171